MSDRQVKVVLFIIGCISLMSILPVRQIEFEFNIEKLFSEDDQELSNFQAFKAKFNTQFDDEYIFIGLKSNAGIFNREFLQKTDSLSNFIANLSHITKVYSLTSASSIYLKNEEINARKVLNIDRPDQYFSDSLYLFGSPEYRDLLVSNDGKSIAIAAFNMPGLNEITKETLIDSIQKRMDALNFEEAHLTAKIKVEQVFVSEIKSNLIKYLSLSLLCISIVMYLFFRSLGMILISLLIIGISMLWTFALFALTGEPVDIVSSLIPPILAAICMSDIVHISTHFLENLKYEEDRLIALNKTFKEIGKATFYTCCTVAAGFFALSITGITPIRNFGIYTGIGLFVSFIISISVLYAYFRLVPNSVKMRSRNADDIWNRILSFLFRNVVHYRLGVLLMAVVIIFTGIILSQKIEINASLLDEIPRNHPMVADYRFIEQNFSGTRPFEMSIKLKADPSSILDLAVLRDVERIENFLKDSCNIGLIISPLSLIKGANKAFKGGDLTLFTLPQTQTEINRYKEAIHQTQFHDEFTHYLSADEKEMRMSGKLPNISIKEFAVIENRIHEFVKREGLDERYRFHLTGSAVMLDKSSLSVTQNLFSGIYLDIILISIIALLILGNWRIIFIMLIPNILPLLIMASAMALMHINIKADTSVIFAISLGIAVDDTIHFMSRMRMELNKGLSLPYAIKRTYLSTGKAIILTTLVLLSGFMTLMSSSFGGAFYIGFLISLCLFVAVLIELTITPVLLLLFYKRGFKTKS